MSQTELERARHEMLSRPTEIERRLEVLLGDFLHASSATPFKFAPRH